VDDIVSAEERLAEDPSISNRLGVVVLSYGQQALLFGLVIKEVAGVVEVESVTAPEGHLNGKKP
jgi:chemotaxis signal transduction protein